jgi:hypothetical protein
VGAKTKNKKTGQNRREATVGNKKSKKPNDKKNRACMVTR